MRDYKHIQNQSSQYPVPCSSRPWLLLRRQRPQSGCLNLIVSFSSLSVPSHARDRILTQTQDNSG